MCSAFQLGHQIPSREMDQEWGIGFEDNEFALIRMYETRADDSHSFWTGIAVLVLKKNIKYGCSASEIIQLI